MIDDRMRGPGHGTTTVWVYDERRRVRDDVAARLVALPFVGRVEVVGDPQSLMSRLATRQPDVLLVGTQRAVDSGVTAATQVLRALPGDRRLPEARTGRTRAVRRLGGHERGGTGTADRLGAGRRRRGDLSLGARERGRSS